jgi:ABC-type nickel/cobalt efflux system permease component RcnA
MVNKGLIILAILLAPWVSLAHPLGNFSISHYTSIRVERDAVVLYYVLDLAEIPTFQELQATGIVPEEGHPSLPGYLTRQMVVLQAGLGLAVDGQRLPLQAVASEILFPPGAGGLPTLKLGLRYRAALAQLPAAAGHQLSYRDSNFPGRAGWQEIIAVAGLGVTVVQSTVPATDRSQALMNYPTDLLNSPPQVREAQVVFTLAPPPQEVAVVDTPIPPALTANRQGTPQSAFTDLVTTPQLSLGVVCLALVVAAGLGAFHAIEPGHGKTVVAAYLVGTRGTARHALALGLIVTATHTAGVYLLGAITLYASHYVVPEHLYPWLGVLSGLTIAGLGGWLLVRRYVGQVRAHTHAHGHGHAHGPMHAHPHTHVYAPAHAQSHSHHDEPAHHHSPDAEVAHGHHDREADQSASFRTLLTLGVTGGIVPCPAALVVLLSAVTLHRVGFGMLLIVAFSIGLAAVLIAIGLLMVYAQRFMTHFQGEGRLLTRWLPLTSAALITLSGVVLMGQALIAAGVLQIRLP